MNTHKSIQTNQLYLLLPLSYQSINQFLILVAITSLQKNTLLRKYIIILSLRIPGVS